MAFINVTKRFYKSGHVNKRGKRIVIDRLLEFIKRKLAKKSTFLNRWLNTTKTKESHSISRQRQRTSFDWLGKLKRIALDREMSVPILNSQCDQLPKNKETF